MAYRYLGNKTRLLAWVLDAVTPHLRPGARVADPMCGTASVSQGLARLGFGVVASDELTFPVLHARARLLHTDPLPFAPAAADYAAALATLEALPGVEGYFHTELSADGTPRNGCRPRAYFTGANAARIDAIRSTIAAWSDAGLDPRAVDLLRHDLVLAANRVANIAGTYGYYRATWNPASLAPLRLEPSPLVPRSAVPHVVLQGKVEEVAARLDVDACYLDPPYTKRQYAGNYHVLETLAVGDEPEPVGEGGLRDWYPQSSDFCSKRRVREAFHETLKRLEVPLVFVSYSEDGLVPRAELTELLGEHGEVTVHDLELPRYRSNGGKPGGVIENLYVVRKG